MKYVVPLVLMLGTPAAALSAPANPAIETGKTAYRQRCQSCHGVATGPATPMAPLLKGVVGRKAASTTFNYSPALKKSGLAWTKANLDSYLASPAKKVPGGRMVVSVVDPVQRSALIEYLVSVR